MELKHYQKVKFLSKVRLYNEILNNYGEILVFDFRSKEEYNIIQYKYYSINLPWNDDTINDQFLNEFNQNSISAYCETDIVKKVLGRMKRFFIVIVCSNFITSLYDMNNDNTVVDNQKDSQAIAYNKALRFYNTLIKNKIRELGFYIDNYADFLQKYVHTINTNTIMQKRIFIDPYPSSILDFKLYVGDESHAKSAEIISLLNITHVVNATRHSPNYFEKEGVKYIRIDIEDHDEYCVYGHFKEAFYFIENALYEDQSGIRVDCSEDNKSKNYSEDVHSLNDTIQEIFRKSNPIKSNNVLIHCSLGVSRSPTFALMYIMKKFNLKFNLSIINEKISCFLFIIHFKII